MQAPRPGSSGAGVGQRAKGYDPQFFAKIVRVEDNHFWFQARNRVIAAMVADIVKTLPKGYDLLEVGCGTGVVLRELARVCSAGQVRGFDLYPEAVAFAEERTGCEVIIGDVLSPPSSLGQFDVVCIFDVLEHVSDEKQTLIALRRLLKPGGVLILTVPAHMSLWSYFDLAACHCRRYERSGLKRLFQENGFQPDYISEFMMVLYPLVWLLRRVNGGTSHGDSANAAAKATRELQIVPVVNLLLKLLLAWEPFVLKRRVTLPKGTSLIAIAQKVVD